MKLLLVHNDYGKRSGEEAVVEKMAAMLVAGGHEVAQLRMTTEGRRESLLGQARGFLAGIYSPGGVRAMREALRRERPDVVNVHNLYPFISPAALFECRRARVPVVMTVHNYRLVCPTGLFMRDNAPCELCLQRGNEWGCVRHNCEHSLPKSLGYAARNAVARLSGAYRRCVARYACLTEFQRSRLIAGGFDGDRICVIPNAVDAPADGVATAAAGEYVAYCGRLSREKGIDLILEVARRHPEIPFRLAGAVREPELVAALPPNVTLVGYLSGDALAEFYRRASFFVMASRWYEGFPMAILEAAQHVKPTVAPDHGGFSEIVGSGSEAIGLLFKPGDADALGRCVADLWRNPDEAVRLGRQAHAKLLREYSTEVVWGKWTQLLEGIVNRE